MNDRLAILLYLLQLLYSKSMKHTRNPFPNSSHLVFDSFILFPDTTPMGNTIKLNNYVTRSKGMKEEISHSKLKINLKYAQNSLKVECQRLSDR